MYKILKASILIPFRKFPSRSDLKNTKVQDVIVLYLLSLCADLASLYLTHTISSDPDGTLLYGALSILGGGIAALIITALAGKMVINKYARVKFTLKEVIILFVVLTAGMNIIATIISTPFTMLGESGALVLGGLVLLFDLYMLVAYRDAISVVGGISKREAVNVMIAPFLALLLCLVLIFLLSLIVAATM